jgi:hypothetical protein
VRVGRDVRDCAVVANVDDAGHPREPLEPRRARRREAHAHRAAGRDELGRPPDRQQAAVVDHGGGRHRARRGLYPTATNVFQFFWSFLPEAADAIQRAGRFSGKSASAPAESPAASGA